MWWLLDPDSGGLTCIEGAEKGWEKVGEEKVGIGGCRIDFGGLDKLLAHDCECAVLNDGTGPESFLLFVFCFDPVFGAFGDFGIADDANCEAAFFALFAWKLANLDVAKGNLAAWWLAELFLKVENAAALESEKTALPAGDDFDIGFLHPAVDDSRLRLEILELEIRHCLILNFTEKQQTLHFHFILAFLPGKNIEIFQLHL